MPKVLISDSLSPRAVEIFKERGIDADVKTGMKPDELIACIGEYDGLAIRSATKVTADVLDAAKNLKVIGRAGIGVDNVDIDGASGRGIVVMNAPFGNSITTAEHAIAMMFSLARQIPWRTRRPMPAIGKNRNSWALNLPARFLVSSGAGTLVRSLPTGPWACG